MSWQSSARLMAKAASSAASVAWRRSASSSAASVSAARAAGAARAFSTTPCAATEVPHLPLDTLSEEEIALKEAVARFAEEEIAPRVRAMDDSMVMDKAVIDGLFEQGFMGVEIEEQYDGPGCNFMSSILVIEELAKIDPAVSVCADVQNTLVNNAFKFWGSDELKAKCLPRLATDTMGCFCLSEESSGSDAFGLKTRAEDKGDHYLINGSKAWITNSAEAGLFLVFANLDPSAGYKGITCFVAERDFAGVEVGKKEDKLGIRASSTCPITFTDVKIPKENVVGEIGKGYKYAIEILNEGRIGIGAQMIGLAQGCFDSTMPYLFSRQQFGSAIGDFQGMQHQYAQIAVEIQAARMMVYNAARRKEAGLPFVQDAAMAKLYSSQVAEKTASKCVEWLGGVGFTKAMPAEKFYRDSKIGAIYEGTSNIQLQTIAKTLSNDYRS